MSKPKVGLYDNNIEQLEDPAEGLRWWLVCEDHAGRAALDESGFVQNA